MLLGLYFYSYVLKAMCSYVSNFFIIMLSLKRHEHLAPLCIFCVKPSLLSYLLFATFEGNIDTPQDYRRHRDQRTVCGIPCSWRHHHYCAQTLRVGSLACIRHEWLCPSNHQLVSHHCQATVTVCIQFLVEPHKRVRKTQNRLFPAP